MFGLLKRKMLSFGAFWEQHPGGRGDGGDDGDGADDHDSCSLGEARMQQQQQLESFQEYFHWNPI